MMRSVTRRFVPRLAHWLSVLNCLGLIGLVSAPARADGVNALRYDLRVDLPVTGAAFVAWIASELYKDELAPSACRWCDSPRFDNRTRKTLRWSDTEPAYKASNWMGFGIVPLGAAVGMLGLSAEENASAGFGIDLLVIAEAALLTASFNQLVKYTVGRTRPFVRGLSEAEQARTDHPSDNHLSFYSAHTSISFSIVVAAGTVATMRGYDGAPLVWALGLPMAAFTSYLRIAADRRYLTDVSVGAVLGSAAGFLIPYLLHSPRDSKVSRLSLSASSNTLTVTWTH